jgi:hypothetical protein
LLCLAIPRWAADKGPGGVMSLNAQLKQEAMTWRAERAERQALTGAELSEAFRVAHGFSFDGDLSPADKAALVIEAIEVRRGVRVARPYPVDRKAFEGAKEMAEVAGVGPARSVQ